MNPCRALARDLCSPLTSLTRPTAHAQRHEPQCRSRCHSVVKTSLSWSFGFVAGISRFRFAFRGRGRGLVGVCAQPPCPLSRPRPLALSTSSSLCLSLSVSFARLLGLFRSQLLRMCRSCISRAHLTPRGMSASLAVARRTVASSSPDLFTPEWAGPSRGEGRRHCGARCRGHATLEPLPSAH